MVTKKEKRGNKKKKKSQRTATSLSSSDADGNRVSGRGSGVGTGVGSGVAAKKGTMVTTTTTTTITCTHGSSTIENFAKRTEYEKLIEEWMSATNNITPELLAKCESLFMKDPTLINHVFASATDVFLQNYGNQLLWRDQSPAKMKIFGLLRLGINAKYKTVDTEDKWFKYNRDILLDRGIINCLDRETNTFCNCMTPFKLEGKTMEKSSICDGCFRLYPKMALRNCSRCQKMRFCSNDCLKENWSTHKRVCIKVGEYKLPKDYKQGK